MGKKNFLNLIIRMVTLFCRFCLIFYLAKVLDPEQVGLYALFMAFVGYSLYFVGLDFYSYMTREILNAPIELRGRLLKCQFVLSCALYVIFIPLFILSMNQLDWPSSMMLLFIPALVLEHFNQELYRLLVALSEQITASMLLFVRQGSWVISVIWITSINDSAKNLEFVIINSVVAGVMAALFGVYKLKGLRFGGWLLQVDWSWIKTGIKVSGAFLIATLALRAIPTLDRFFIESLVSVEAVAPYVLLLAYANVLIVFLEAGIFSFVYPDLIKLSQNAQFNKATSRVKEVFWQVLFVVTGYGLVSWLTLPFLLSWIGHDIYSQYSPLYPWLFSASALFAFSLIPHFALYARGRDKPIIYSPIAALLCFLCVTWFSRNSGVLAVIFGINAAYALLLFVKVYAYCAMVKHDDSLIEDRIVSVKI